MRAPNVYKFITFYRNISIYTSLIYSHFKGAYTPTESSRVQSSPVRLTKTRQWLCGLRRMAAAAVRTHQQSRVESRESCRVKSLDTACFIFVIQTPVIGRDGRNGCREAYSFSEGPRGNLRRLALWTPEPRLTLMMMFITTKTTLPLTTVIMILLLLSLLFKVKVTQRRKWFSSGKTPETGFLSQTPRNVRTSDTI